MSPEYTKRVIGDINTSDDEVLMRFRSYSPSYSLEYVAQARLGLAAFIAVRRPHLSEPLLQLLVQDYFQLGVTSLERFAQCLRFETSAQTEIVARHGDERGLAWLKGVIESHFEFIERELNRLEAAFTHEEHGM